MAEADQLGDVGGPSCHVPVSAARGCLGFNGKFEVEKDHKFDGELKLHALIIIHELRVHVSYIWVHYLVHVGEHIELQVVSIQRCLQTLVRNPLIGVRDDVTDSVTVLVN